MGSSQPKGSIMSNPGPFDRPTPAQAAAHERFSMACDALARAEAVYRVSKTENDHVAVVSARQVLRRAKSDHGGGIDMDLE
jgi:hypothetical protein